MWILRKDKMPEEKHYHSDGNMFVDGKDRDWSESERVLVVNDEGRYYVDSTRNGKFRSDGQKDIDNFPHEVIAWQPIEKFDIDNYYDGRTINK